MELSKQIIEVVRNGKLHLSEAELRESDNFRDIIAEIYHTQMANFPHQIFRPSNLLQFIVPVTVNRLVITLKKDNYKVSTVLLNKDNLSVERTLFFEDYDNDEFLNYIDNSLIIPSLLDILKQEPYNQLFIDWHIIAEIRDYRTLSSCEPRFTLLKSSTEANIQGAKLVRKNRSLAKVEASLLLKTSNPLCLNPSPLVSIISNQMNFYTNIFMSPKAKSLIKRKNIMSRFNVLPKKKKIKTEIINPHETPSLIEYEDDLNNINWDQELKLVKAHTEEFKQPIIEFEEEKLLLDLYSDKYPIDQSVTQSVIISIRKVPEKEQYRIILSIKCQSENAPTNNATSIEFNLSNRSRVNNFISKFTEVFSEQDTKLVSTRQMSLKGQMLWDHGIISFNNSGLHLEDPTRAKSSSSFNMDNLLHGPNYKYDVCSIFSDWSD